MLHCGGKSSTLEQLGEVILPEETRTYKPVSHMDLVVNIETVAHTFLHDYEFHKGIYGLASEGQRMFGIHQYKNSETEIGLSIGFRNSYDKSMSVGIAVGASVFVCDNLILSGEVSVLRKHSGKVIDDLEVGILKVIYKSRTKFTELKKDAAIMKEMQLTDDDAYRNLGLLYGQGTITPRQLPVAKHQWLKPDHEEFGPRNLWSLYNDVTHSLKSCPANKILEKHIALHDTFMKETIV